MPSCFVFIGERDLNFIRPQSDMGLHQRAESKYGPICFPFPARKIDVFGMPSLNRIDLIKLFRLNHRRYSVPKKLQRWWRRAHSPPSTPGVHYPIAPDMSPISRLLLVV